MKDEGTHYGYKIVSAGVDNQKVYSAINEERDEALERETYMGLRLAIEAYWVEYE
jgi:hypothetical protein